MGWSAELAEPVATTDLAQPEALASRMRKGAAATILQNFMEQGLPASPLSCASPSSTDIIYNRHRPDRYRLGRQRIGDAVERMDHRPDALALDEPEFDGQRRSLEDCCANISVGNLIRDHEIGSFCLHLSRNRELLLLRNCCSSSLPG